MGGWGALQFYCYTLFWLLRIPNDKSQTCKKSLFALCCVIIQERRCFLDKYTLCLGGVCVSVLKTEADG